MTGLLLMGRRRRMRPRAFCLEIRELKMTLKLEVVPTTRFSSKKTKIKS
jgi:hypothetical protein